MSISGHIPNINFMPLSVNAADLAKSLPTSVGKTLISALKSVSTHVATFSRATINFFSSVSLASLFFSVRNAKPEKTTGSVTSGVNNFDHMAGPAKTHSAMMASDEFYEDQSQKLKNNINNALKNITEGGDDMPDRRKITTSLTCIGRFTCASSINSNVKAKTQEFLDCNVAGMKYSQYGSTQNRDLTTEQKEAFFAKTQEIKIWADSL